MAETTDNAPVTAEHFMEAIESDGDDLVCPRQTEENFEELLSRARKQSFSEGRKAGLKEIEDELKNYEQECRGKEWEGQIVCHTTDIAVAIEKLRQEYSAK